MIRQPLIEKHWAVEKGFRWRGGEVSRIEGFSDAAFAFAVTLLVVSLEVPLTFDELWRAMRGSLAFGVCFLLLMQIWYRHYKFFRRYALQDSYTMALNAILLFVVLLYIYPLKFLFTWLINDQLLGLGATVSANGQAEQMIRTEQIPALLIIYGLGFLAVNTLFALLHYHAYRKRGELELTELEVAYTKESIQSEIMLGSVALASIAIAAAGGAEFAGWAGLIYWLIAPLVTIQRSISGARIRKLRERIEAAERGR